MRIIQLTDLHINSNGEETYGVDVRSNFLHILAEIKFANPDYLILTGDLCLHQGDMVVYRWIKERLEKLEIPYALLPGNHDDTQLMRLVFDLDHIKSKDELYYALKLEKQTCLFMDSSKGKHSTKQLNWLKRQLKNATQTILVFTHHPPIVSGVPFMDTNYALQDMAAIQNVLETAAHPVHLFCGHYHVEKTIHFKHINVHITPSCYVQIGQDKTEFEVDHDRIAFRQIDLTPLSFQTTVRYFKGHKL